MDKKHAYHKIMDYDTSVIQEHISCSGGDCHIIHDALWSHIRLQQSRFLNN
jgi:hypothetical protein